MYRSTSGSPPTREEWIEIGQQRCNFLVYPSPPTREEWIEMGTTTSTYTNVASPPTREEWIEIVTGFPFAALEAASPPTREEWIEMESDRRSDESSQVSSHAGGVD